MPVDTVSPPHSSRKQAFSPVVLQPCMSKEEINILPIQAWEGPVVLVREEKTLADALEKLRQEPVLGFDTETRPTFTKGKTCRPALIQLATADTAYLIQLTHLPFSEDIAELLSSPRVLKVGVAIHDDMKALARIHPFQADGVVDLAVMARARGIQAQGLRTPQSVTVPCGETPPLLPFGWPVIVKPADSPAYWNCRFPGKRKVYLADSAAVLEEILGTVARGGYRGAMLVQEYIPGPDTTLGVVNTYCARDGSVPWIVQGQVLLQERTPEGVGNYGAVLVEPARQDNALLAALAALLRESGWRGYANFDLKYDPRGEPVLFEMNPRQGRASYFCTAAGANLARPLVEDLVQQTGVTLPALRPAVWYTAPWGVVRRYCPAKGLWRRAASLRRRGRGRCHLLAPGEGPARRVWYWLRQGAYWRKVKNYG